MTQSNSDYIQEMKEHIESFSLGDYVEDCAYHPGILVEMDDDGDATVHRLTTNRQSSCHLWHCGVRRLDHSEAMKLVAIYQKDGDKGLAINAGWTEEQFRELMR